MTGANKGIGYETARQLANLGVTVLMGARDQQRGKEAAANLQGECLDVRFLHLDINDLTTHEAACRFIEENFGKLDIYGLHAIQSASSHRDDLSLGRSFMACMRWQTIHAFRRDD